MSNKKNKGAFTRLMNKAGKGAFKEASKGISKYTSTSGRVRRKK